MVLLIEKFLLSEKFEELNLLDEIISELGTIKVLLFPIELDYFLGFLFFFRFTTLFEEWMLQTFFDLKSEIGVENQNFVKQVNCLFSSTWIHSCKMHTFALWEGIQVF